MKAFITALVLIGLLSSPAMASVHAIKSQTKISLGGIKFKVSRYNDGRTNPSRIYFWQQDLTGSSYRFDLDGQLVYFKAGSEVYFDRMEDGDGSLTFEWEGEKNDSADLEAETTIQKKEGVSNCADSMANVAAVCQYGLFTFCDNIDTSSLGPDGVHSVNILCDNSKGLCSDLQGESDEVCLREKLEQSPRCDNGFIGIQASNGACCDKGCGQCGGSGCSRFGEATGLDENDCCATEIVAMGAPCTEAGEAPCYIGDDSEDSSDSTSDDFSDDTAAPMCDNGFIGIQASNGACCDKGCGQCGGSGCSRFGEAAGLDENDCCATEIVDMGTPCTEAGEAPCYIGDESEDSSDSTSDNFSDDTAAPMCDNGFIGIQASNGACCDKGCGQCGGSGCSRFGEAAGLDENDCCATEIVDMGTPCTEAGEAPCYIGDDDDDLEMLVMDGDSMEEVMNEVTDVSEDEDSMDSEEDEFMDEMVMDEATDVPEGEDSTDSEGDESMDEMVMDEVTDVSEDEDSTDSEGDDSIDEMMMDEVMGVSEDEDSTDSEEEDEMMMDEEDAECNRASLSSADQERLDVYYIDMYIEPLCKDDTATTLPNGCNFMGLGQGCRSCYATCGGALYYIRTNAEEIKEQGGEYAVINFCPDSGLTSLDDCRDNF